MRIHRAALQDGTHLQRRARAESGWGSGSALCYLAVPPWTSCWGCGTHAPATLGQRLKANRCLQLTSQLWGPVHPATPPQGEALTGASRCLAHPSWSLLGTAGLSLPPSCPLPCAPGRVTPEGSLNRRPRPSAPCQADRSPHHPLTLGSEGLLPRSGCAAS